jgi:hypothetical protein
MVQEGVSDEKLNSDLTLRDGPGQICLEVCKYIQTDNVTALDKAISGTYAHPDLIPHIAS